ncbi:MAG: DUF2442 domain-containing protein [Oscillospiraceae bacterium]|nr:DUF2442 domain-containing protein [Oscillospiraceae bacterium]
MESYYPIEVKPLEQYKLLITFDNSEKRIFDVTPYLSNSFFAPLKNPFVFQSVKLSPISIEWIGGIDKCPDELYYNSVPIH